MADNKIVEDLTTAAEPNIADTDEIVALGELFQQSALPSLGRQIFPVIPISGPTGGLFNIRRKELTNDLEVVRNNVAVFPSQSINTSITQEAIQDIRTMFGREADVLIGTLLRGLANDQENAETLNFLDTNAIVHPDHPGGLQLSDSMNAETNLFEITQAVHELVLKMNSKTFRTYEAFAVLPWNPAMGAIASLIKYAGGYHGNSGLLIAEHGTTKFYMNPNPTSITAYVGLKATDNPLKSSAVFSPYVSDVVEALDPDSGEVFYHIFNRFAITLNPLSVLNNEMLYKFDILE